MASEQEPGNDKDVVATSSAALSREMEKVASAHSVYVPPEARAQRRERAEADIRFERRQDFLESPQSDPNGFERIIGESDLTSISFLDRGRRAAAAVCRIKVPSAGGAWYGTGFLVGPRLIITNNHVIGNEDEASQCAAEFEYEHDIDGVLNEPVRFNLRPHELFFTSAELDVTFVAVTPLSDESVPIERYGRLPLVPLTGKVIDGEWVTIIQHPGSQPKQIAIRASQIIVLKGAAAAGIDQKRFLHYSTDTEPGSSGAPVLNDQWQVVAVHHKAVPAPDPQPRRRDRNGREKPVWIANEGVRISAIFNLLESQRFQDRKAAEVLNRLEIALGLPPLGRSASSDEQVMEADRKPLPLAHWKDVDGYRADFLPSAPIELAPIYAALAGDGKVASLRGDAGHELAYRHFSVVIHKGRKFPLLTAVNIAGDRLVHPGKRANTWRRDARIDDEFQPAGNFYEKSRGDDPVQFSRGHQVRLLDPCWSMATNERERLAEAKLAAADTFHYTNAAPQVQNYNDSDWGDLEDYLLDKAQIKEKRLTVFTGPIFRETDPWYGHGRQGGPWRIPISFWKIAVLQKTPDRATAAAFIIGQSQYVKALYEAKVFTGLQPYTIEELRQRNIQTTIKAIEDETGLDFAAIRALDAQGSLESTRQARWITQLADIVI